MRMVQRARRRSDDSAGAHADRRRRDVRRAPASPRRAGRAGADRGAALLSTGPASARCRRTRRGRPMRRRSSASMALMDWTPTRATVARTIRAYDPSPGAFTTQRGEDLKLFGARPSPTRRTIPARSCRSTRAECSSPAPAAPCAWRACIRRGSAGWPRSTTRRVAGSRWATCSDRPRDTIGEKRLPHGEMLGDGAGVVHIVERATAAGCSFGLQLGQPPLVPELHRQADHRLAGARHHPGDDGAVDAAAHRDCNQLRHGRAKPERGGGDAPHTARWHRPGRRPAIRCWRGRARCGCSSAPARN